jgi:hypothetical protein
MFANDPSNDSSNENFIGPNVQTKRSRNSPASASASDSASAAPPLPAPLQRQTSTQMFNTTIPTEKEKYDKMITDVNAFLAKLIGFEDGTHARKGIHDFIHYFCQNADSEQIIEFLTAVLLPLQFDLETCRDIVSDIGEGYALPSGRPPVSYLRMFSLDPSDQLPLALAHINQKNLEQGYLQEGTLNQFTDQGLLTHTIDFFESELEKRKEDFTTEQIGILLMNPSYVKDAPLHICGVEVEVVGANKLLDFSPKHNIAGHVTNIKNLTLSLVSVADTNKELLRNQETPYPEQKSNEQLELLMVMKLGKEFNKQHKTLTYEVNNVNMKLVTSSYLARLYVFAVNFRDMVRKEYQVDGADVSKGKPFEKLFLFNLARSIALVACTVPEMEDPILLSKKLGSNPELLKEYFENFAKATKERNGIFSKICQVNFLPEMFENFPPLETITINTLPIVFKKYFLEYFKSDDEVIGVYPEIMPFKEYKTLPNVSLGSIRMGFTSKINPAHVRFAQERKTVPGRKEKFTSEIIDAIDERIRSNADYKEGYKDGFSLRSADKQFTTDTKKQSYLEGYISGQNAISGLSNLLIEVDNEKEGMNLTEMEHHAEIEETRSKMAYSVVLSIKMLFLDGMENSKKRVETSLKRKTLYQCMKYFCEKAEIAAKEALKAAKKTTSHYNRLLEEEKTTKKTTKKQKTSFEKVRENIKNLEMAMTRDNNAATNAHINFLSARAVLSEFRDSRMPGPKGRTPSSRRTVKIKSIK